MALDSLSDRFPVLIPPAFEKSSVLCTGIATGVYYAWYYIFPRFLRSQRVLCPY